MVCCGWMRDVERWMRKGRLHKGQSASLNRDWENHSGRRLQHMFICPVHASQNGWL
jgi:hypothetical protein